MLEVLRRDKTVQEIAARHQVHPNQVSIWKLQAVEGLGEVFADGPAQHLADHEAEGHPLHAKITLLLRSFGGLAVTMAAMG